MQDGLTIGAFGRLTGLSPKALRHYDRIGLLKPDAVDPQSGYRRYGREQIETGRDRKAAERFVALAREEAEGIEDAEERELFEGDIGTVPL